MGGGAAAKWYVMLNNAQGHKLRVYMHALQVQFEDHLEAERTLTKLQRIHQGNWAVREY